MKALNKILLGVSLLVTVFPLKAVEHKGFLVPAIIENGDTIPSITLPEVYVFPKMQFTSASQEKFYWKTVRDVKVALPYARLAAKIIKETDEHLAQIPNEGDRKKYIKQREKVLFNQFENDLKNLTISQGKILIRLIDRECNRTTYDIIKSYKGSFSAFLWQGVARIFGSNLKWDYDGNDREKIIERVITLVELGLL